MYKNKEKKVYNIETKLKKIIYNSINKKKYEKALQAIDACASLLYQWNQKYADEELEKFIEMIANNMNTKLNISSTDEDTILFYDNFGLDTRGLALIYINALVKLHYNIVYVTVMTAKDKQPEIDKILNKSKKSKKIYLKQQKNIEKINEMKKIYLKYKPKYMFFYSTPNDAAGVLSFSLFNKSIRYQINLTDHAFWLGKYFFDYCIEFRNYGASISYHERGINIEKLIIQPYYPFVNHKQKFQGFPIEVLGKKVIFSGGSLYKTIGRGNYFYKIVDSILEKSNNTLFIYASNGGDTRYINQLQNKYINRVFHINERKDLYQLMQHIDLYINTYPMVGGLMMQYAALAGKVPLTLRTSQDGDDILINQDKLNIEFSNYTDLVHEALKLLNDTKYQNKRSKEIKNSVISEQQFIKSLNGIIRNKKSNYETKIRKIDTKAFQSDYMKRFCKNNIIAAIANKNNISLKINFPIIFLKKIINKIMNDYVRKKGKNASS